VNQIATAAGRHREAEDVVKGGKVHLMVQKGKKKKEARATIGLKEITR